MVESVPNWCRRFALSGRSLDSVIREIPLLSITRYLVSDVRSGLRTVATDSAPKVRFSATLGEEPQVELALV